MTRRDWLLLLTGLDRTAGGLEPVRVQKALFLLAQEGGIPPGQRYRFVPYNYGPMSAGVYRDVDALVGEGLLERLPVPGYTWGRVRATERGRAEAARVAAQADAWAVARLDVIREHVQGLSFADLLEDIYERYPDYAAASVFRRHG